MLRNATTGALLPPLQDPTIFYRGVLEGCLNDTVFRSRCAQWMREHRGSDAMDFLWAVLRHARNEGALPTFPNVGSAVAFALAQPVPDEPSQAAKEREQAEVLIRSIEK